MMMMIMDCDLFAYRLHLFIRSDDDDRNNNNNNYGGDVVNSLLTYLN